MNLLILSQALENYRELIDITWANQREYAVRHGYDFHGYMGNYCALGYDYQRIQMLYDVLFKDSLGKHFDAVWWLGTDCLVMEHTKRVESFLKPEGKSLYFHLDVNSVNNDSFVIYNTEWSKRWLEMTLAMEPHYRGHCWLSQKCWSEFLTRNEPDGTPWRNQIGILHHPGINSYLYDRLYNWPDSTPGQFFPGSFLLHLPGCSLQQRLDTFRSAEVQGWIVK